MATGGNTAAPTLMRCNDKKRGEDEQVVQMQVDGRDLPRWRWIDGEQESGRGKRRRKRGDGVAVELPVTRPSISSRVPGAINHARAARRLSPLPLHSALSFSFLSTLRILSTASKHSSVPGTVDPLRETGRDSRARRNREVVAIEVETTGRLMMNAPCQARHPSQAACRRAGTYWTWHSLQVLAGSNDKALEGCSCLRPSSCSTTRSRAAGACAWRVRT